MIMHLMTVPEASEGGEDGGHDGCLMVTRKSKCIQPSLLCLATGQHGNRDCDKAVSPWTEFLASPPPTHTHTHSHHLQDDFTTQAAKGLKMSRLLDQNHRHNSQCSSMPTNINSLSPTFPNLSFGKLSIEERSKKQKQNQNRCMKNVSRKMGI